MGILSDVHPQIKSQESQASRYGNMGASTKSEVVTTRHTHTHTRHLY